MRTLTYFLTYIMNKQRSPQFPLCGFTLSHTQPGWVSLLQCCSFHHDLIMISRCVTMYSILCGSDIPSSMNYIHYKRLEWICSNSGSEKYPSWERTFQSWSSLSSLEDNTSDQNEQERYSASCFWGENIKTWQIRAYGIWRVLVFKTNEFKAWVTIINRERLWFIVPNQMELWYLCFLLRWECLLFGSGCYVRSHAQSSICISL